MLARCEAGPDRPLVSTAVVAMLRSARVSRPVRSAHLGSPRDEPPVGDWETRGGRGEGVSRPLPEPATDRASCSSTTSVNNRRSPPSLPLFLRLTPTLLAPRLRPRIGFVRQLDSAAFILSCSLPITNGRANWLRSGAFFDTAALAAVPVSSISLATDHWSLTTVLASHAPRFSLDVSGRRIGFVRALDSASDST